MAGPVLAGCAKPSFAFCHPGVASHNFLRYYGAGCMMAIALSRPAFSEPPAAEPESTASCFSAPTLHARTLTPTGTPRSNTLCMYRHRSHHVEVKARPSLRLMSHLLPSLSIVARFEIRNASNTAFYSRPTLTAHVPAGGLPNTRLSINSCGARWVLRSNTHTCI